MIIRSAYIYSMTEMGEFQGDILIRGSRIEAVAPHIDLPEDAALCVLEAQNLHILPGMIDLHVRETPEAECMLLSGDHSAGVTMGILWPAEEAPCSCLRSDSLRKCVLHVIRQNSYTDVQLQHHLIELHEKGFQCACEISSTRECHRILELMHRTGIKILLALLADCDEMAEVIAESGCPVVIGAASGRTGCPWKLACRLQEKNIRVAITSNHPAARLRHLPLCAALCLREGMDRTEALQTVTTAPAAILGLSDAGCIKAGCCADLAIYDGDPMLLATSHVMTIENGRIRH